MGLNMFNSNNNTFAFEKGKYRLIPNILILSKNFSFEKNMMANLPRKSRICTLHSITAANYLVSEKYPIDFTIIDEAILYEKQKIIEGSSNILTEFYSSLIQNNSKATVVILFNENSSNYKNFKKLNYSTVLLIKNQYSIFLMTNFSYQIFCWQSYRSLLTRDFLVGESYPVDLYFYRPKGQEYSMFLSKGETLTTLKLSTLISRGIGHLYLKNQDFDELLKYALPKGAIHFSEELHYTRKKYKMLIGELIDNSKNDYMKRGQEINTLLIEIIDRIQNIINLFPSKVEALSELPFSDDSFLSHGINLAIYSLCFSKLLKFENATALDFAKAALLHDIGKAAIAYKIDTDTDINTDYKNHVEVSRQILKQRMIPISSLVYKLIHEHHETYNGLGYPNGLIGKSFSDESAFFSVLNNLDLFHRQQLENEYRPLKKSWGLFYKKSLSEEWLAPTYNPNVLQKINDIF
ncbi:MAG: HD domain-containing protein [Oligoflexia bacterium]|nr:HD domain-containing protein [Oligoflexia bacterium]